MNSETKQCQNCKQNFTIEPEDFQFYEKIKVPAPTFCPQCRMIRRLIFWNEHFLFRKKEAIENKEIFSTFPEVAPVKIYEHDYWFSDAWDPMSYGRNVDFSKSFLEQYKQMIYEMPWPSRSIKSLVNSDYCNQVASLKNCYLCFNAKDSENCLYGIGFQKMKDCSDFYWSFKCELSYEFAFSASLYQSFFTYNSSDGRNLWFCENCDNCSDCFGSVNLRHKQYYIFNEPYAKEEYFKKIKEFNLGSYKSLIAIKEQVKNNWLKFPVKYAHSYHNENVTGDYVSGSKNAKYVFQGGNMENVKYVQNMGNNIKDSYDYTNWGENAELIYDSVSVGEDCRNLKFCFDCWPGCQDLEYSISCHSSSDLFACFGLKKKQYCILNKEYSKDEYFALREKLIKHMSDMPYKDKTGKVYKYGEFFPGEFSPLAYNETVSDDYFSSTKEKVEAQGLLWRAPHPKEYVVTISADKLPDHINDVTESILKETIGCLKCKKAYRILERELEFYKRFSLPLPRLCQACRYTERAKIRNPLKWYKRQCVCDNKVYKNFETHAHHPEGRCPNEFETTYAPDRKDIVYCESCYQNEVV